MRTASILISLMGFLIVFLILTGYARVNEIKEAVESLQTRPAGEKSSFSFAVLGDSSTVPGCPECQGNAVLAQLVQKINQNPPDFIVYTGDGPEQGVPILSLQTFRYYLDELKAPWYPVLGNHEIMRGAAADGSKGDGEENYISVFKDKLPVKDNRGKQVCYYSFDLYDCHFIVLNTAWQHRKESGTKGLYPGGAQWKWFVNDLQKASQKSRHIFIFTHEPPLLPGIFRFDNKPIQRDRWLNTTWHNPQPAAAFLQLCRDYGVEAVFSGHYHGYLKFKDGASTHIISGVAGSVLHVPALLGGYYHYILCSVNGDRVTYEVIRLD